MFLPARVMSRCLFPAAATLEIALATAATLHPASSEAFGLGLKGCILLAAKVLEVKMRNARAPTQRTEQMLDVVAKLGDGSITVRSEARGTTQDAQHLRATICSIPSHEPLRNPNGQLWDRWMARLVSFECGRSTSHFAQLRRNGSSSSYYMNPASGDASLHLAAVSPTRIVENGSISRVPVSMELYSTSLVLTLFPAQPSPFSTWGIRLIACTVPCILRGRAPNIPTCAAPHNRYETDTHTCLK
jgi:hypothetical protein